MRKKVNAKPKNLDDQEIPFKLREIMKLQKEMSQPKKKRKRKAENKYKASQRPEVPFQPLNIMVPKFKKKKTESVHHFIQHMDNVAKHVMFLTNNQPVREPEKLEPLEEESAKTKPKKEFDRRREVKMLKKKAGKKVDQLEKEMFQDRVQFGEVAMEPPTFTVKPRKGVDNVKPGERQLLLKNLFNKGNDTTPKIKLPPASLARQRIIEEERERVVQAYRALKTQKQLQRTIRENQLAISKRKNPK
ncbi:coiled-coil domain-containing protein 137 [Ambystoma mexicanum]|uniref:coiled-coil domain-containing protein 137 n=1 Tax=Ambystoma mexicanum TaxID=8296 RepID=UPI0037E8F8FC